MSPSETLLHYFERAARALDNHALMSVRYRGIGAIHALYASGLLTSDENAAALGRLVDTCHVRYCELTANTESREMEVA